MNLAIHCDTLAVADMLVERLADCGVDLLTSMQDWSTTLFRDPDLLGLLATNSAPFAKMTIAGLRRAGIANVVMVLVSDPNALWRDHKGASHILSVGADDVQALDIDKRELAARLAALDRRRGGRYFDHQNIELPAGAIYSQREHSLITADRVRIGLSKNLASLLEVLARHTGSVVSKQAILDDIYGGKDEPDLKVVDVMICKLRQKIMAACGGLDCIETVHMRGYLFCPAGFNPPYIKMRRGTRPTHLTVVPS